MTPEQQHREMVDALNRNTEAHNRSAKLTPKQIVQATSRRRFDEHLEWHNSPVLTISQACKKCGLSEKTFRKYAAKCGVPLTDIRQIDIDKIMAEQFKGSRRPDAVKQAKKMTRARKRKRSC